MRLVVLPGDGIGPIVIAQALRVMEAVGAPPPEVHPFGLSAWEACGEALPAATVAAVREAGSALLGAATSADHGPPSPILALRRALGLDLLVRPAVGSRMDLVLVAHAFAGLYGGVEAATADGAWVERRVREAEVRRLVAVAATHARRRITVVDKPTVFRATAAMFRDALATVPVPWEVVNADAYVAAVVRDPSRYDVVVALSFLGDVLSDLHAALATGLATAPSASLGERVAVFEPLHGSAPRHATTRPPVVDPLGAVRAAVMWLRHEGLADEAERVEAAVRAVLAGDVRTPDLGGNATTAEVGDAVLAALGADRRARDAPGRLAPC